MIAMEASKLGSAATGVTTTAGTADVVRSGGNVDSRFTTKITNNRNSNNINNRNNYESLVLVPAEVHTDYHSLPINTSSTSTSSKYSKEVSVTSLELLTVPTVTDVSVSAALIHVRDLNTDNTDTVN